ncbi:MAG: type II toxin-antitoxin system RelE/ParE family toxin [Thermoguttaceae bacterium]
MAGIRNKWRKFSHLHIDTSVNTRYIIGIPSVEITPAAAKELDKIGKPIHNRIHRLIEKLADWPAVSGAKPLRGNLAGHYRLRTGDYRVQFHVVGDIVIVEKIGHRDGFYED